MSKYIVLQSIAGTSPITGQEIVLSPGDTVDWCPVEGPKLIEAGVFAPATRQLETPEAPKAKSKHKETR